MRQLVIVLLFISFNISNAVSQSNSVSPSNFYCGQTISTVCYTCGSSSTNCSWSGMASVSVVGGLPAGVSFPNGPTVNVISGQGDLLIDVVPGITSTFDLIVTTDNITNNPGGCMSVGYSFTWTITVVDICPTFSTTTLSCGQTSVDVDWGCDWDGQVWYFVSFPGLPSGITTSGSSIEAVTNGQVSFVFNTSFGVNDTFCLKIGVFDVDGNCGVQVGDFMDETIVADCPLSVSPSILPCGQTTVTIDWGCDWDGEIDIPTFALPSGVTVIGNSTPSVTAGVAQFILEVTSNAPNSFILTTEIFDISSNSGSCNIAIGDFFEPIIIVDCPNPPVVSVSPILLPCGQTTVTVDYGGCGWTGSVSVSDNNANITYPNGTTMSVSNGIGTIVLDLTTGTTGNFDLTLSTGGIGNNPGNCMPSGGPPPFTHIQQMIADCPAACALTASTSVLQDETCFGDNDGIATASSSNGSGSYTYLWNDPSSQTTATASGLAPGSYTVTVTDTVDGCTAMASVTIAAGTICPSVLPTTVSFGQTTVTVDYGGCGWSGTVIILGGLPGVTLPGGFNVVNGQGSFSMTVASGITGTFILNFDTDVITGNPNNCMPSGFPPFTYSETMTASCPNICPSGTQANTFLGNTIYWNDPANWSLGTIPTLCDDVLIPAGLTCKLLSTETGECYTLEVQVAGDFEVEQGGVMEVVAPGI